MSNEGRLRQCPPNWPLSDPSAQKALERAFQNRSIDFSRPGFCDAEPFDQVKLPSFACVRMGVAVPSAPVGTSVSSVIREAPRAHARLSRSRIRCPSVERRASTSQRRWLREPENHDYFCGEQHVDRVQASRAQNLGYCREAVAALDAPAALRG